MTTEQEEPKWIVPISILFSVLGIICVVWVFFFEKDVSSFFKAMRDQRGVDRLLLYGFFCSIGGVGMLARFKAGWWLCGVSVTYVFAGHIVNYMLTHDIQTIVNSLGKRSPIFFIQVIVYLGVVVQGMLYFFSPKVFDRFGLDKNAGSKHFLMFLLSVLAFEFVTPIIGDGREAITSLVSGILKTILG